MENVSQRLNRLFCACFLLAALCIALQNGHAAALLALPLCLRGLRRPLPHFTRLLFGGVLFLRVFLLLSLHPPVTSDFSILLRAARSLLAGDLSFCGTSYFQLWAYQSPFVAWEAFWLALWDSPVCLELVNAVLSAGTACLLYRMAREWMEVRAAQAAAVLLAVSPFPAALHTVLSNQIPSAFFLTMGLWLLVCGDCRRLRFLRFPLAGLALQLGNLLRCEGVIFLTAVLAWAVFEAVRTRERRGRLLAGTAALLLVYLAANVCAGAAVRASGLNPNGVRNGNPMWKFVAGMNYEHSGGYSDEDWSRVEATLDGSHRVTDETRALQRALLADRLSRPAGQLLRHLGNKICRLWADDALYWEIGHLDPRPWWYTTLQQLDRGLFFLALGLACLGLPGAGRRSVSAQLPYFIFFASFCAFLLIEVQPRYAFLPQLYVFTAAGFGLERLERRGAHA